MADYVVMAEIHLSSAELRAWQTATRRNAGWRG